MTSRTGWRLFWILVALAALVVVAAVAYHLGGNAANGGPGFGRRGFGMMGPGWDGGWFGLVPGLFFFLGLILLFVVLIGAPDRTPRAGGSGPGTSPVGTSSAPPTDDVARLRELSDLHERGHLTDEEFAAAKRKILGL